MLNKIIHILRRDILVLRIPKTLLISSIRLDQKHKKEVLAENAIERTWHHKTPPFTSSDQILAAFATKRLAQVEPNGNLLPIRRLRNPQLIATYPSYLTVQAHELLIEVGTNWRKAVKAEGFDNRIRIAITSLIRTKPYQDTLVKAGKLADPDSAHTRGEAFDIDASGYYIDETPINPRTTMQSDFQDAFKELGADVFTDAFGDFSLYQPKVHEILKLVLMDMQKAGKLHFVHEFPGTGNDVFHVCRNPEYKI